jgi:hypothetical protein
LLLQHAMLADVADGSKSDMCGAKRHVGYAPEYTSSSHIYIWARICFQRYPVRVPVGQEDDTRLLEGLADTGDRVVPLLMTTAVLKRPDGWPGYVPLY